MDSHFTSNPILPYPSSAKSSQKPQGSHGKKTWVCEVCDRTMSEKAMQSHLAGKPHQFMRQQQENQGQDAKLVSLGGSIENNPIAGASRGKQRKSEKAPRMTPGPTGKGTWACDICLRSVDIKAKDIHLTGMRHMAVLDSLKKEIRSREEHPTTTRAASTEGENSGPSDTVQLQEEIEQRSTVLKLRIIPSTDRAPKLKKQITNPKPYTKVPPGQWHCDVCSRTMLLGSRDQHCLGHEHRAKYRAMKIQEGAPAPRRIGTARKTTRVGGGYFCGGCGKKVEGGGYCVVCDFRVDVWHASGN